MLAHDVSAPVISLAMPCLSAPAGCRRSSHPRPTVPPSFPGSPLPSPIHESLGAPTAPPRLSPLSRSLRPSYLYPPPLRTLASVCPPSPNSSRATTRWAGTEAFFWRRGQGPSLQSYKGVHTLSCACPSSKGCPPPPLLPSGRHVFFFNVDQLRRLFHVDPCPPPRPLRRSRPHRRWRAPSASGPCAPPAPR